MKTIKLPYYNVSNDDLNFIKDLQRQQSIIIRYSYNKLKEKISKKDLEQNCISLNNISDLDSWFIRCGILTAEYLLNSNDNKKIIFGGKYNYLQYIKNKITKEEYKNNRLSNIAVQGEANQLGNRKFKLNIIENNQIIFKPYYGKKIILTLPKLSKNYKKELTNLELYSQNKEIPYAVQLNSNYIYISFDEKILKSKNNEIKLLENRCLGIDLNPNYIGISVLEFDKENNYQILAKQAFDLSKLTIKSNESSDNKKSKYIHNKLKFETLEISKKIINIAKSYNCKFIFAEDLIINSKNNNIGKNFNRLVNNKWLRTLFINNLEKRCNIIGMKLFKVNPAYSSYIGNLLNDSFDPINSSIEICRRGYEVIIIKDKKFYPDFNINVSIQHRWKEMGIEITDNIKSWKELISYIKNSKIRYRVSLDNQKFNVFSLNSKKSMIKQYCFI